jgi:hypothetical protein
MYAEQYLARARHQERIEQAEQERAGQRVVELRKLEKKQERAERHLLQVWLRLEQARSAINPV